MEEYKIIKLIRFHLLSPYHEQGTTRSIEETLSIAASYLMCYWEQEISFTKDLRDYETKTKYEKAGTIEPLYKNLKKLKKPTQKALLSMNQNAREATLLAHFKQMDSFKEKLNLVNGFPFLTFQEGQNFTINKSEQYITNICAQGSGITPTFGTNDLPQESQPQPNTQNSDLDSIIKRVNNSISDVLGNIQFNLTPYIWQLKIAYEKYKNIKDILSNAITSWPADKTSFISQIADAIVVYIAEWYKWEYNGNNQPNVWESLGIDGNYSKLLWDSSFLSQHKNLLYTGENNTLWLNSIYVLGGFPLTYLRNPNLQALYERFIDIYNNDNDDTEWQTELIDLGGAALTQSINKEDGSLHQLVDAITKDNKPFDENDINQNETVRQFINMITIGLEQTNKVRINWQFIYNMEENTIYPSILLKLRNDWEIKQQAPGKTTTGYIHYNRLKRWGFTNPQDIKYFHLIMKIPEVPDYQQDLFTFYNCHNDTFVISGITASLHLYDLPSKFFPIVEFHVQTDTGESKRVETQRIWEGKGYCQAYRNGQLNIWTDNCKSGFESIVVFNDNWKSQSPKTSHSCHINSEENENLYGVGIITQKYTLCNINGNNTIELSNTAPDILRVEPKLYKGIQYTDGQIWCFANNENVLLPLIVNKDIEVYQGYDRVTKVTLEYRQGNNWEYTPWDNQHQPTTGLCTLRISANNRKTILECFLIATTGNGNASWMTRKTNTHYIQFSAGIPILAPSLDNNHRWNDNLSKSTIEFKIGDENEYAIVPIYSADNRKELYRNGTIIKSAGANVIYKIPMLLRNEYAVCVFNTDGRTVYFAPENLSFLNEDYITSSLENLHTVIFHESKHFRYILWENWENRQDTKYIPFINEEQASQYKFYYWDIQNENISEVETIYDPSSKTIALDQDCIAQLNEGEGIIFQSLQEGLAPNRYFQPFSHLTNNPGPSPSIIEIIKTHHLPFRTFDKLFDMAFNKGRKPDGVLTDFFINYASQHGFDISDEEYTLFWKMAEEYAFDWVFLTLYNWRKSINKQEQAKDKAKNCVQQLFAHNPNISKLSIGERTNYLQFTRQLLSIKTNTLPQKGCNNLATTALKFLSQPTINGTVNYRFTGSNRPAETICEFLKKLYGPNQQSFQYIYHSLNANQNQ